MVLRRAVVLGSALSLAACNSAPSESRASAASSASSNAASAPAPLRSPVPGGPWNSAQIDWQTYDAGMALAKRASRPVLLVVTASWCPHCKNFSHVFEDPDVVQRARDFVMIRIDADDQADVAARYAKDGGYIPRTYFLAPGGEVANVQSPNPRFHYFYDEHDPRSILAGMTAAVVAVK